MSVLQIRDENGNFIPIPAIRGDDGKSAYEQAKEGGYKGEEEEFIAILNSLTFSEDSEHRADFNNPHKVSCSQINAAQADHKHSANDLISDVLGIECGGTGANNAEGALANLGGIGKDKGVPTGLICMWSGLTIPDGWQLCDGTNGTPDLRDRFIVGSGNQYAIGATGGEATHTLTINEMPSHSHSHSHSYTDNAVSGQSAVNTTGASGGRAYSSATSYAGTTSTDTTTSGGDSNGNTIAHNNLPPYYALAFIMKL